MGIQADVPPDIMTQTSPCVIPGLPSCIFVSHLNAPLLRTASLFVLFCLHHHEVILRRLNASGGALIDPGSLIPTEHEHSSLGLWMFLFLFLSFFFNLRSLYIICVHVSWITYSSLTHSVLVLETFTSWSCSLSFVSLIYLCN